MHLYDIKKKMLVKNLTESWEGEYNLFENMGVVQKANIIIIQYKILLLVFYGNLIP